MARQKIHIDIDKIEELAGQGLTEEQIADCLGISTDTIWRRKKESAEFREAIKRGKSRGIKEVTNALMKKAMGGNVVAQMFYLCNRDPENWKHINRIETTGANGNPIEIRASRELRGDELISELAKRGLPTNILEE